MANVSAVTADAIAMTEKKMDMSLDDIIRMSKKTQIAKKKQNKRGAGQGKRPALQNKVTIAPIRRQNNRNKKVSCDIPIIPHLQQSIISRSSALRQGKLAERRSRNGVHQFPAIKEAASRAAALPIRTAPSRWNKRRNGPTITQPNQPTVTFPANKLNMAGRQTSQTLDSRFANIREQRKRIEAQGGSRPLGFVKQPQSFRPGPRNHQQGLGSRLNFQRNFNGRLWR